MTVSQAIELAFAGAPYPGDAHIPECPCDECQEIAEFFRGKTNQGHSVDDIRSHQSAMIFFTDAAFRYYLPAYMRATIEDLDAAEAVPDLIIHAFTSTHSNPDSHIQRMRCLTVTELDAVRRFLEWLQVRHPKDESIYEALYCLTRFREKEENQE